MFRGNGNYKNANDLYKFRLSPLSNYQDVNTYHNVNNTTHNLNIVRFQKNILSDIREPDVFGPPLWFSLHNGSLRYPEDPSPIFAERMKGFIYGLPYILPCEKCQAHAISYIEGHEKEIKEACTARNKLFKFFVDFHNSVNKRLGKPEVSLDDALKLYSEDSTIQIMKYN